MRSFVLWIREKVRDNTRRSRGSSFDDMVLKSLQGWQWKKGGRAKYRREAIQRLKFAKDLEVARNYILIACVCTRWD